MKYLLKILFTVAVTVVFSHSVTAQKKKETVLPKNFDAYVEEVMKQFEVPGLAIGVVINGEVVLEKGYGVREMGKNVPVDANTLFPIASNSKAFTATALALLVEEGKLEWDAPVIKYLPWFRLSNSYVTEHLSIRDLLVHRSGIAPYAGDLLWYPPTSYTREEIVYRLRYLPLANSFRNKYAYDNVFYIVAAEVIKEVSGTEFEDFISERIFSKIGMNNSLSKITAYSNATNKVSAHAHVNGNLKIIAGDSGTGLGDVVNAAGGISSSVTDMNKWMITQLDSGRAGNGQLLFHPATSRELWTGVVTIPVGRVNEWIRPAQSDGSSYALGFRILNYRGEKMVTHGGKLDGYVSFVNMIPGYHAGIVVLTNQESSNAYRAIINKLADHIMKKDEFDWLAGYKKEEIRRFENYRNIETKAVSNRNENSKPSLPLKNYAGKFYDQWYGNISVEFENGKLIMRFEHTPQLVGELEFWQYNSFVVRWYNRNLKADAYVNYSLDENGKITGIKMKAVSPVTDVSFDFHDLDIKPRK